MLPNPNALARFLRRMPAAYHVNPTRDASSVRLAVPFSFLKRSIPKLRAGILLALALAGLG
jgi:hypothetical protein